MGPHAPAAAINGLKDARIPDVAFDDGVRNWLRHLEQPLCAH